MDKEQIEKFRRHMGAGKTIKLKNEEGLEDEFYFKPLGCEFLPDFMSLALALDLNKSQKIILKEKESKVKKGEMDYEEYKKIEEEFNDENMSKMLEQENSTIIIKLLKELVKTNYPELDQDTVSSFVSANFTVLTPLLLELHETMNKQPVDERILRKIEQIKAQKA